MAKQHAHKYQDKNSSGGSTQHEGHEMHNGHNGMKHDDHNTGQGHEGHKGGAIPVLALSPMIHRFLGLGQAFRFSGDLYVIFVFSSAIFFYGGYPFLKGLIGELKDPLLSPLPMYTAVLWYSACRARYSFGSSLP